MGVRFQRAVAQLQQTLRDLSITVEDNLQKAILAMQEKDPELAKQVIEADLKVDQMEIDVEEECLKILALYQPVAGDLRLLITMLKVDNDLERIGDLAKVIAKHIITLCERPPVEFVFDWTAMIDCVRGMVRDSLDSLIRMDLKLAYAVCALDDEVDAMHKNACNIIEATIQNSENAASLLDLLAISHSLENIADHAKKIAEDTIYTVSGEIVRHQKSWNPPENSSQS